MHPHLSVTRVDHTKTVEVWIMKFSPYGSPIHLVFREQDSSRNFKGLNEGGVGKIGNFRPLSRKISETVQDRTKVVIGMCTRAFHWYQNQCPWV